MSHSSALVLAKALGMIGLAWICWQYNCTLCGIGAFFLFCSLGDKDGEE